MEDDDVPTMTMTTNGRGTSSRSAKGIPPLVRADPRVAPLEAEVRRLRQENELLRCELACRPPVVDPGDREAARLSPRERQVLELIARGRTTQQIADALCIGVNSVKTHTSRIYRKLDVRSRTEAAVWALSRADRPPMG